MNRCVSAMAALAVVAGALARPAWGGPFGGTAGAGPPAEAPAPGPPPPIPEVDVPPIPPVAQDPYKPGLAAKPGPAGPQPLEESKHVFARSGRIAADQDGRTVFLFDSGDPPMRLLENSLREYLEDVTKGGKLLARWRISGLVTEYRKRNYLLVSRAVRVMPEEGGL